MVLKARFHPSWHRSVHLTLLKNEVVSRSCAMSLRPFPVPVWPAVLHYPAASVLLLWAVAGVGRLPFPDRVWRADVDPRLHLPLVLHPSGIILGALPHEKYSSFFTKLITAEGSTLSSFASAITREP